MKFVGRKEANAAFAKNAFIEVPAPEFGEGAVMRFKGALNVLDMFAVAQASEGAKGNLSVLLLALVRQLWVDDAGKQVIGDDDDKLFLEGVDATLLLKYGQDAGLLELFTKHHVDDGGGSTPFTVDAMREVVAALSVSLGVTPESVKSMSQQELIDLLKAFRERAKSKGA